MSLLVITYSEPQDASFKLYLTSYRLDSSFTLVKHGAFGDWVGGDCTNLLHFHST